MRYLTKDGKFYVCDLFAGAVICLKFNIQPKDIERVSWADDQNSIIWGLYPHTYKKLRDVSPNGKITLYRSFGSLWSMYGPYLALDPDYIDRKLCISVDNNHYTLRNRNVMLNEIFNMVDSQYEEPMNTDEFYYAGVEQAIVYLKRMIKEGDDFIKLRILADKYFNVYDQKGVVIVNDHLPDLVKLARNYNNVNFVIMPDETGTKAKLYAVKALNNMFRKMIRCPKHIVEYFNRDEQILKCSNIQAAFQIAEQSLCRAVY